MSTKRYAETVPKPVDRKVARLVDAINRSDLRAETAFSCSGHATTTGYPYVAYRAEGWEFTQFLLQCITAVNRVTDGRTRLEMREVEDDHVIGILRLVVYPWLWAGDVDWIPVEAEVVNPPRRLVHLWWAELDALAQMIEQATVDVCAGALDQFRAERSASRRRPTPRWASHTEGITKELSHT